MRTSSPCLSSFRFTLFLFLGLTAAGTAVEAGEPQLPNPIVRESVFAGLVFGRSGPVRFEADLVVSNPNDREAFVRFELLGNDGRPAPLQFDSGDPFFTRGRFTVPPRSVQVVTYNQRDRLETPALYQGWGRMRANLPVDVMVRLRTVDARTDRPVSTVELLGNPRPLAEARLPVILTPGEFDSGIAVTAPGTELETPIRVQLLDLAGFIDDPNTAAVIAERLVTAPPNGQTIFSVKALFEGERGDFVRVLSEQGVAATVIGYRFDSFSQQLEVRLPRPFDFAGQELYRYREEGSWDFEAGFGDTQIVGEARLTPTEFGVYLESFGAELRFFPFAGPEIFIDTGHEIAIVGDARNKIVVFGDGFTLEEPLPGHELAVATLPDGRIEIEARFGAGLVFSSPAHKFILIDPETRQIVARFAGERFQQPPWRE